MTAALIGFLAPFLPDLIGLGRGWLDHRAEMQAMRLRLDHAAQEHQWRLAEIETGAQIRDLESARRPHRSYGVKLLSAAADAQESGTVWRWSFNLAFLAFAALDWLISSVRPTVTYYLVALYGAVKAAKMYLVWEITGDWSRVLTNETAWTPFDQDVLVMVLAFWFGDRLRRRDRGQA